jgi:hypothetical protein
MKLNAADLWLGGASKLCRGSWRTEQARHLLVLDFTFSEIIYAEFYLMFVLLQSHDTDNFFFLPKKDGTENSMLGCVQL